MKNQIDTLKCKFYFQKAALIYVIDKSALLNEYASHYGLFRNRYERKRCMKSRRQSCSPLAILMFAISILPHFLWARPNHVLSVFHNSVISATAISRIAICDANGNPLSDSLLLAYPNGDLLEAVAYSSDSGVVDTVACNWSVTEHCTR